MNAVHALLQRSADWFCLVRRERSIGRRRPPMCRRHGRHSFLPTWRRLQRRGHDPAARRVSDLFLLAWLTERSSISGVARMVSWLSAGNGGVAAVDCLHFRDEIASRADSDAPGEMAGARDGKRLGGRTWHSGLAIVLQMNAASEALLAVHPPSRPSIRKR